MDDQTLGRRDRKHRETRARIEAAATSLVIRDGLDATTVDAISALADISPRTFFNYFDSKDAAVLGLRPRDLTDDLVRCRLAERPSDAGVVESVVGLLLGLMGVRAEGTGAVHRDRLTIIGRHPEIVSGQFAQLSACHVRLVEIVAELLAQAPAYADDADLALRAEVVLALCGSATRAALHEWADRAGAPIDDVEERAVALATTTLERLR